MSLAWHSLNKEIIKGKVQLNTNNPEAVTMVNLLNGSPFSTADLDEKSYYIKAGFGQKTVQQINRESKEKFPSKSFGDLNINLAAKDFISYAYLLKEVEYPIPFEESDVTFNNESVEGFFASTEEMSKNVQVLHYSNNDQFIVKLDLKDQGDELYLAKGYDMKLPQDIIKKINGYSNKTYETLGDNDYFNMPKIHVDIHRYYNEILNIPFKNPGYENYMISIMYEKIKFDINQKGARVEQEAVIIGETMSSAPINKPVERYFYLNKPFWLIMKRKDSQTPYFILGVNNIKLMNKL